MSTLKRPIPFTRDNYQKVTFCNKEIYRLKLLQIPPSGTRLRVSDAIQLKKDIAFLETKKLHYFKLIREKEQFSFSFSY